MRDVQATFEIFQNQRDTYKKYGLKKPLAALFSGASIGKGYLEALDIPPFMKAHPDFDHKATGVFMERINERVLRLVVAICDLANSQPDVYVRAQLGFLRRRACRCSMGPSGGEVFLEDLASNTLGKLLNGDTWPLLRGAALIVPDNDVVPIRAPYDGTNPAGYNIRLAIVKPGGPPLWVLFPDIAVSILKTGRCPNILQTVELVPHGTRSTK